MTVKNKKIEELPTSWRTPQQKLDEVAGMVAYWRAEAGRNLQTIGCPDCRRTLELCASELEYLLKGMEVHVDGVPESVLVGRK